MKRLIALLLMSVLAAQALTACSSGASSNVIKIGEAVALTGDNSAWGLSENKALQMEIDKINKAGGVIGKQLQLVAYDTRADATEGVNVTQRLINEGVCAIIGPGQSGVAIAMTAVTEPGKVPFIATSATNPKVTVNDQTNQVYKYSFRTCFIDPFQGTVAAQFVYKDLNLKNAAIIYDVGSDYSSFLGKYFTDEFQRLGGTIVANEAFRSGELDFHAILGKIKGTNPDVMFIPLMQKEASLVMKQSAELGIKCQFIGGDGWASPDLITLGGDAVEGSFFVNVASLEDPDIQTFVADYKAKYNEEPVLPNPIMAIDGLLAVVHCIEQNNGADPVKIAASLEQIKDLQVLSGLLTIDPATHNPLNKPAMIQQVKNGQFILFKKYVTTSD